jgi:predicted ferric reductase
VFFIYLDILISVSLPIDGLYMVGGDGGGWGIGTELAVQNFTIRFAALIGYTSMFLATIMTPFMVELYKIFGKPFIKQHHLYSILGLVLITIHPVSFAISKLDITVFIPVFYPWIDFWELAGRPALILIYIAVVAAILRKKIKKWKWIHFLNYLALLFGYVHGVLIGTDFQNPGILIIFTAILILLFVTFGLKRYQNFKRK